MSMRVLCIKQSGTYMCLCVCISYNFNEWNEKLFHFHFTNHFLFICCLPACLFGFSFPAAKCVYLQCFVFIFFYTTSVFDYFPFNLFVFFLSSNMWHVALALVMGKRVRVSVFKYWTDIILVLFCSSVFLFFCSIPLADKFLSGNVYLLNVCVWWVMVKIK